MSQTVAFVGQFVTVTRNLERGQRAFWEVYAEPSVIHFDNRKIRPCRNAGGAKKESKDTDV